MKGWKKSNLIIGEELKVPKSIFIEPEKAPKRLKGVYYIGETEAGIMIDCVFQPCSGTKEPQNWHYRMMINWASIWCGHIKVNRLDGTLVRAQREQGLPLAIGKNHLTNDEDCGIMYS